MAVQLQLAESDLMKVINSTSPVEDVAWKVLHKWANAQGDRATCSKLYSALCNIECKALADKLSELLSSYDDEGLSFK